MSGIGIDVTLEVSGLERFGVVLEEAPISLKIMMRQALMTWTEDTRDQAASNAPSKTGALAGSLTGVVDEAGNGFQVTISSQLPYAQAQEGGADIPPHAILPVNAKALAWEALSGAAVKAGAKIGDKVFFAAVMHPGAIIQPKQFIANAMSARTAILEQVLTDLMVRSIGEGR